MRDSPTGGLDATTLPPAAGTEPDVAGRVTELIGLVLLWSRDEPGRIGEALLLSPRDPEPWIFGRGKASAREGARRISLVRQRPGTLTATGPLECPRVSRVQLRLVAARGGGLLVENVGACPLSRDGIEISRAELAPGDRVALRNELLFLCVRRTMAAPPAGEPEPAHHPFGEPDSFGIVGESQAVWELRRRIATAARQNFHALILGESGSGKELVAQAVHAQSARGVRPMIARNAATIPEGLADAELFGNVRNYPNSGMPERPGLVGQAHGSTLFLDEFADLPVAVQTRLLRVMDEGEYHRLGEATARRSDLRIVAATNRPASHIKPDLLARLKIQLSVPDLNARAEDIPLIAAHLLRRHAREDQRLARRFFPGGDRQGAPSVSPLLIEALVAHRYTTHVRELDALLIRSMSEADDVRPPEGKQRYVEPARELRRSFETPTPSPLAELEGIAPVDQRRLALLRQHRFSPTRCARDPAYLGNRQAADLHLRRLIGVALRLSDWSVARAAALLAGTADDDLRAKAVARTETFLANMRARLAAEPEPRLQAALAAEWKGNLDVILALVAALRAGKIDAV